MTFTEAIRKVIERVKLWTLSTFATKQELDNGISACANSLKGGAVGESRVLIPDVSAIPHQINCKVSSKNLFNPLCYTKENHSGITIEYLPSEDCFLLNGTKTVTSAIKHNFINPISGTIGDKYTISATYVGGTISVPAGNYAVAYFGVKDDLSASDINWFDVGLQEKNASKIAILTKQYITTFWFYITAGVAFDNYKVKIQLEKSATATAHTPHIEDLSVVKVKRYGKNLCELGTRVIDLNSYKGSEKCSLSYPIKGGYTYKFSANLTTTAATDGALIRLFENVTDENPVTSNPLPISVGSGRSEIYFIVPKDVRRIDLFAGSNYQNSEGKIATYKDIQMEIVSTWRDPATAYEPFVEPTEHSVNADGTVDGITSVYPNVTLLADTVGANLDVTYNLDINQALSNETIVGVQNTVSLLSNEVSSHSSMLTQQSNKISELSSTKAGVPQTTVCGSIIDVHDVSPLMHNARFQVVPLYEPVPITYEYEVPDEVMNEFQSYCEGDVRGMTVYQTNIDPDDTSYRLKLTVSGSCGRVSIWKNGGGFTDPSGGRVKYIDPYGSNIFVVAYMPNYNLPLEEQDNVSFTLEYENYGDDRFDPSIVSLFVNDNYYEFGQANFLDVPVQGPDMSAYTDAGGVELRCTYQQDLSIVLSDLRNAIISLGGRI